MYFSTLNAVSCGEIHSFGRKVASATPLEKVENAEKVHFAHLLADDSCYITLAMGQPRSYSRTVASMGKTIAMESRMAHDRVMVRLMTTSSLESSTQEALRILHEVPNVEVEIVYCPAFVINEWFSCPFIVQGPEEEAFFGMDGIRFFAEQKKSLAD